MNKTININLGGIFFHIDETAYQKLKRYLDAIRKSLSDDPQGRDEIITDIESRISELLSERVKDQRQVVSESDIDEVIGVMGQPEDYMVDEELFIDDSGKNYSSKTTSKKLFRDGDDKFLGGVASGMAHYLNIDVIWVRLIWLILAFGFGFGFLVYPILWILLPEAKTTAEKLQMEGEAVNITNIERKIRAEFEDASERVKDAASDVKDAVKEGYNNVSDSLKKKDLKKQGSKARSGLQEIIETLGNVIGFFFKIIGKLIGILLILLSISLIVFIIISFFTAGTVDFLGLDTIFNTDIQVMNPTGFPLWLISLIAFIIIGIPLLMLFFLGMSILSSKSKILSRTAKFVLLGIWLIALLSGIFIVLKTVSQYAREGSVIEKQFITAIPNDTLKIKMVADETLSEYEDFNSGNFFRKVVDANDETKYYSNNIDFYVKESDSAEAYLKLVRKSNGSSRLIAKKNAEQIQYNYNQIGENLLLDVHFLVNDDMSFRDQEMDITLYILKDQIIYFDENTRRFLRYAKTIQDMNSYEMNEHYFKMTNKGLDCLDCINENIKSEDEESEKTMQENDSLKSRISLNADEDGMELKISDNGNQAAVKVNKDGVKIK